jgi:protein-disulfide isomerase
MKKIIVVLLLATALVSAQTAKQMPGKADTSTPAPSQVTLLPSQADIDAAMRRTLGYDPALTWTIIEIRPATFAGMADVIFSINKQAPQHMYISAADTQNAIFGEMIPFGTNPFAPARAKLQAADGPSRGPQKGVITIVEFSDLECPHCKAAHPIVEKLAADFPQVKIIFQQFPLPASIHPWAQKAAQYTDCAGRAGNDGFWKYAASIFENQGSIALATADDKLKELATAAGLDAAKISACAATPETDARIKKSMDLGQSLDVNSTPTFFINGRRVQAIANIPYDQLKLLVQFEIDNAGK